ncbi:MAG: DUF1491 family protein [Beijerinckiaceae bacterium]
MTSARLKSEIWCAAWLRRCIVEGVPAYLNRRGAADAGAILLKIDRLDGTATLYGPAFQDASLTEGSDRVFRRLHQNQIISISEAEDIIARELRFDLDLWVLESEDRLGRVFAEIVDQD